MKKKFQYSTDNEKYTTVLEVLGCLGVVLKIWRLLSGNKA